MTSDRDSHQLGVWMTSAIVVGSMIGSGIFLLPVSLAPLGINAVVGWVVSGFGALAIAYSLARLAHGGAGIQAYIEEAFGPTIGYLVTFSFWCSNWAANAALAIATASAIAWLNPKLNTTTFIVPVAAASVVILALVNSRGARTAGGLSVITVLIKILPLLAVIAAVVLRGSGGESAGALAAMPFGLAGLGSAVALTLFALTGFENATTLVNKVRDPARTIPLSLVGGTFFVVLLYLVSSTCVLLLLNEAEITASASPFADAVGRYWGGGIALIAIGAIAVSAFGGLNGMILATGELGYSMALRGDLPRVFASTRGANTPVASQWLGSGLAILLILANGSRSTAGLFTFVILLSTVSVLVVYFVGSLAAWKHSRRAERPIIVVALGFSIFALWGSGAEANAWGLVLLATGYVLRLVMRRLNSRASTSPAEEASPAAPPGSTA
jgi:basic amino acid/polyamine antiporter, APA family